LLLAFYDVIRDPTKHQTQGRTMARQAEKEHTDGPYSIRRLDAATKRDALAATKRAGLHDVGEWWTLAARTQLAFERGDLVRRTDDGVVESQAMTLIDDSAPGRLSIDEMARVVEIAGNIASLRGKLTDRALTAMLGKVAERIGLTAADLGDRPLPRAHKALGADVR